jgi:hypothetical protein
MIFAALLFGAVPLFGGTKAVQLLVIDHTAENRCRPAPAGWDSTAAPREARAAVVAEDLRRYFGGLSAQFTPILEAAWHGRVRFCTDAEEDEVLGALAVLVVRCPHPKTSEGPDLHLASPGCAGAGALPGGAEELLKPLAGKALIKQLEAIQPANAAERDRQQAALGLVRSAAAGRQP